MKKGSFVNSSYIFWTDINSVNAYSKCSMRILLNAKVTTDPKKHEESIVDETWAILKNSINFHRKKPMKKGSLVNNSYIFWTNFNSVNAFS